jgi:hypothetical protein
MRIKTQDPTIEVSELGGESRVKFNDRNTIRNRVVEKFHIKEPLTETDRGQKTLGDG